MAGIDDLLAAHVRFPALFEGSGDAIALYRLDGTIAAGNAAAITLVGARARSLRDAHFFEHIARDERGRIERYFNEAAGGTNVDFETTFVHRGGHDVAVNVRLKPALVDGSIVGVYGYARDITAERQLQAAFGRSRSQFKSLFENHPSPIVSLSLDGRFIRVNAAAEKLSGFRSDELIGRMFTLMTAPDKHERIFAVLREIRLGHAVEYESAIVRKDGKRISVAGSALPQIVDGIVVGYYAALRDLTTAQVESARRDTDSFHDALTGLPNRAIFTDRLERSVAESKRQARIFAVLRLDIDRFKETVERYGPETGDDVLRELARLLHATVRQSDTVARFGSDDFAILQAPLTNRGDAGNLAKRLIAAVGAPIVTSRGPVPIAISIGIALHPSDATTSDALVEHAEGALATAKLSGRQTYRFFNVAS